MTLTKKQEKEIFAVFAVVKLGGKILATTRPNSDKIGLIGGKVDKGETIFEAVEREAYEEGAKIKAKEVMNVAYVDGKKVAWIEADYITLLSDWKEKHRGIIAKFVDPADLSSGFGNEFLK